MDMKVSSSSDYEAEANRLRAKSGFRQRPSWRADAVRAAVPVHHSRLAAQSFLSRLRRLRPFDAWEPDF